MQCGGNDLGGNANPERVADTLFERFLHAAPVVVLCTEIVHVEGSFLRHHQVPANYFEHLQRFNARLEERCDGASHVILWRHSLVLKNISGVGVHLNDRGMFRYFPSIRQAVCAAVDVQKQLTRH